jgi:hypothetical protein
MIPDSKRRFLYNKRVAADTFVFLFHKGPSETSWNVRDYPMPGSVGLRHASDFRDAAGRVPLASEIRASSEHGFPAPANLATDLDHWYSWMDVTSGLAVITWMDLMKLLAVPPGWQSKPTSNGEIQRRVAWANPLVADPGTAGIEPNDGRRRFRGDSETGHKK